MLDEETIIYIVPVPSILRYEDEDANGHTNRHCSPAPLTGSNSHVRPARHQLLLELAVDSFANTSIHRIVSETQAASGARYIQITLILADTHHHVCTSTVIPSIPHSNSQAEAGDVTSGGAE